jgi:hypothetical protein
MTRTALDAAIEALERELGGHEDNLFRANLAARGHKLDKMYGQSGQTLGQIRDGYHEAATNTRAALNELRTLRDKETVTQ